MLIIVDTNILFSACISAEKENKLSGVLFSQLPFLKRISCYYAIAELFNHQEKLVKASRLPADKFNKLFYGIIKQVDFFNEDTIAKEHWLEADRLTKDVDSKDISFVALTLQTGGTLWTGDKKLYTHLTSMGFNQVKNTTELHDLLYSI